MPPTPKVHAAEVLTAPDGQCVEIDVELVPVVRGLWDMGLRTLACCQDHGESTARERGTPHGPEADGKNGDGFIAYHRGYAMLKMPYSDAIALANMLTGTPFKQRIQYRWESGGWRINVPVVGLGDRIDLAPYAYLHIPRDQIAELGSVLPLLAEPLRPCHAAPVRQPQGHFDFCADNSGRTF